MGDMINVTVHLSGAAADVVGENRLEYSLVAPAEVSTVVSMICAKYSGITRAETPLQLRVNGQPVAPDAELANGDEIEIADRPEG
jgi:molybdopterin converting factor small subunit